LWHDGIQLEESVSFPDVVNSDNLHFSFNDSTRELNFILECETTPFVEIHQLLVLKLTAKVNLDLEFFDDFEQDNFIQNMAVLLGIDSDQIRIVSISPGSVIVETEIDSKYTLNGDMEGDDFNATKIAADLAEIAAKLQSDDENTTKFLEDMGMEVMALLVPPIPVVTPNYTGWNITDEVMIAEEILENTDFLANAGESSTLIIGLVVGAMVLGGLGTALFYLFRQKKAPIKEISYEGDTSVAVSPVRLGNFERVGRLPPVHEDNSVHVADSPPAMLRLQSFAAPAVAAVELDNISDINRAQLEKDRLAEEARQAEIKLQEEIRIKTAEIIPFLEQYALFIGTMELYEEAANDPKRLLGSSKVLMEQDAFRRKQWPTLRKLQSKLLESLEVFEKDLGRPLLWKNQNAKAELMYDINIRFASNTITAYHGRGIEGVRPQQARGRGPLPKTNAATARRLLRAHTKAMEAAMSRSTE
jgi:hypothetical protein